MAVAGAGGRAAILDDLEARGLIYQVSDPGGLREALQTQQTLYCGFDPTADSLHVGNLVPLMALRRFQEYGHRPIALLGGGTGLIGDPSGKSAERRLNEKETVAAWVGSIRKQVSRVLDLGPGPNAAILVDNYDWLGALRLVDYLRDVGKHFSIGSMLAKESVRSRLENEEVGISYTEFSYMILQAYDYLHLCRTYGCRLQIGGSDQWGNITAGVELIRRTLGTTAFVLTFPLITTASGKKFGKTEEGTVWLDPERTSPYAFYQFWLNVDDRDVVRFLRYFTLLPLPEIAALEQAVADRPERREAQRVLARSVTTLIHGADETHRAEQASEVLFGRGDIRGLDARALEMALASAPQLSLPAGGDTPPLYALLVQGGLVRSGGEARRNIQSGGVYMNGERVQDPEHRATDADYLHGRYLVLRLGKKNYLLVRREAG